MRIILTGAGGHLGKTIYERLGLKHTIIPVYKKDCNLTNQSEVRRFFDKACADVVIHTAALVGEMTDHISRPTEYYSENVKMNTFVVDAAQEFCIDRLIAITSTGIYPDVAESYPIKEDALHDGSPTPGFFSYSISKRGMSVHIDAIRQQYNKKYCYLAIGNMYGKHDRMDSKSHFIATLMKNVVKAKKEGSNKFKLYGTGKPLRQFINSSDVADVIDLMIERDVYESFNLTDPENRTVDSIARMILKSLGFEDMIIEYDRSKPDGQYRKDVSIDRFMGLFPDFEFRDMEEGLKEMFEYNFNNG